MRLLPSRRVLLLGVVLPGTLYLLAHLAFGGRSRASAFEALGIDPSKIDADTISPRLAQHLGIRSMRPATELVAVVISADFCAANAFEGFREVIASISRRLSAQFEARPEVVTRIIGISLDSDARRGVRYLADLADFDEVIAGGNWLNTGSEKYLWAYPSDVNIPQIVILQRVVTWSDKQPNVEDERVLSRIVGAQGIIEWAGRGMPVTLFSRPAVAGR